MIKATSRTHASQPSTDAAADTPPKKGVEEVPNSGEGSSKQNKTLDWRNVTSYQWIFGLVCLGVMYISNTTNLKLNEDASQITRTLPDLYISQRQHIQPLGTGVNVGGDGHNTDKKSVSIENNNELRHACDSRTKDITLAGYPYEQMSTDNQLMRMERAFFSRREYFNIVREETGFSSFASHSPETDSVESFDLTPIGEGVQIFSGDSFPAKSTSTSGSAKDVLMPGSRLFLGVGDWAVFDTCIALAAQLTGSKPRMFANELPRAVQTDTDNPSPDYHGVEVILVSDKSPESLLGAAKSAWSDPNSNNIVVVFIWLETLDATNAIQDLVVQSISSSNAAHATVIMGNGFHSLFRASGGKFGEKLTADFRKSHVNSALRAMMSALGPLRPQESSSGEIVVDIVWTDSMILDSANLMALPSPDILVDSLGISHDLNMLPTFDEYGVLRTRKTFPNFPLYHVSRGIFDRRYPGVRCDGMGYSASVNVNEDNDGCQSTWRVLESYVQVMLNVVENGHNPFDYLPFGCVT